MLIVCLKAVGQLCSTPNVSDNLSKCESLVARASAAGAKVGTYTK